MIKTNKLNEKELRTKIYSLGDFVIRYINGRYEGEYDLNNPCAYDEIIGSGLIPEETTYSQAVQVGDVITIVMKNGDIVEIIKSIKKYYTRDEIINECSELFKEESLRIEQTHYKISGKKKTKIKDISIEEVLNRISSRFNYKGMSIENIDFSVNLDNKSIVFLDNEQAEKDDMICSTRIYDNSSKKIKSNRNRKIIQSNKFKEHMRAHNQDFIIPYKNIIEYAKSQGVFKNLNKAREKIVIELPVYLGYSSVCKVSEKDTIVYGKRFDRHIYSKFTLDGQKTLINKCVMILNRSYQNENEYYMSTMFPGSDSFKEIQDKYIQTDEELQESIKFWDEHALIFDPKTIDLTTVTYNCPYKIIA